MATQISAIESQARALLEELSPRHWTSAELTSIIGNGIRDLWRSIVDLKGEHFLVVNTTDVTMPANSDTLLGVPKNVHKVYAIEPVDISDSSTATGRHLGFMPIDYNHKYFQSARARTAATPDEASTIYYAITGAGGPATAPTIYVAPQVDATVSLRFAYIPTLGELNSSNYVPIPGEADNALIAWTVAYARAKELESRAPDDNWLRIYSTEKQNLLNSLGVRQYQEPQFVDAMFEEYW